MKEHPILFSAPMVQAILEGRKTQTRRTVKPQPKDCHHEGYKALGAKWHDKPTEFSECWPREWACRYCGNGMDLDVNRKEASGIKCPYGVPGDILVPLTTWAVDRCYDTYKPTELDEFIDLWTPWTGTPKPDWCGKLRPGRFMPKFLRGSLPRLQNTGVRVQRLQDISEEDAIAEGAERMKHDHIGMHSHRRGFESIWDSINGPGSWEANPWVWAISFKRIEEPK